jgi:uncharacterized protein YggU (UPF0235/DUF167 family)
MIPAGAAWAVADGGLVVAVRVTPRAGRDALAGVQALADGQHVVAVRVRAVPEGGAANAAAARLLAEAAGVPASAVVLIAGARGRQKKFRLGGDGRVLAARLAAALDM